jgi:hypothetical protein
MAGNPNSARARFKAYLKEHGEEAALKFGAEIGMQPARIKRLIRVFTGQAPIKQKPSTVEVTVEPVRFGRFKPQVYLFGDKTLVARYVAKGPEQSEVKFPNGNVQTVDNDWLTPFETEEE